MWWSALKGIALGVPVVITVLDKVGTIATVEGISMQPALNPDSSNHKDVIFLNKWAIRSFEVSRGDIVCFISPKNPERVLIKRVIGLENDVVSTKGYTTKFVRIPEGHCWVEGDNKGHTIDSNCFGPISLNLITAKATRIIWPPSSCQSLKP